MVLSRPELIASLQNEVRILLHLAGKLDPSMLDYRPSPKQRSAIELLRYLTMMGPALVEVAKTARFDPAAWTVAETAAASLDFDQALARIATHVETYAVMLQDVSEVEFRAEIGPFGERTSRGAWIVDNVLCGCAAYRMQLFLYLKACGRHELTTMNLWAGVDEAAAGV